MWNRALFNKDVKDLGGPEAAAIKADFRLTTIISWQDGSRKPHFLSLAGIATALGFKPDRYL
jgi:hypothetical protein